MKLRQPSYPPVGSQPRCTLNRSISSSPSQNAGNEMPETASAMPAWSIQRPRSTPDTTPIATPATVAQIMAKMLSSSVGMKRSPISRRHRLPRLDGAPEIAGHHVVQEAQILRRERPVETEPLAHGIDILQRRVRPRDQTRRITRQHPHETEREERDGEHHRDDAADPPQQVAEHGSDELALLEQEPAIRDAIGALQVLRARIEDAVDAEPHGGGIFPHALLRVRIGLAARRGVRGEQRVLHVLVDIGVLVIGRR